MISPLATPLQRLQTFRQNLLSIFPLRRDALFELIDALLLAHDPRSPQELALSPAFRRRWGMVHDALCHGQLAPALGRELLAEAEPPDALTLGSCAVYGLDSTIAARPQADTLADRGHVYSTCAEKAVVGHQYSWLGRMVRRAPAWLGPRDVERVPPSSTPAVTAAAPVARFAATVVLATVGSVIVADSGYAKVAFLSVFVGLPNICVLVRLASNRVLYGAPVLEERHPVTGKRTKRGRPPVHGAKFCLKDPPRPQQQAQATLGGTTARLSAWTRLHFKGLPRLEGVVLRVEFLKADGTPKYRRSVWLFWGGPSTMALEVIVQMYLARYGIEHFFRFAKQRLGLLCAQTPTLAASETWVWLVALAYTQLLLARALVSPAWRPWDTKPRGRANPPLTSGQVLNGWASFSRTLGTPAAAPRLSGKGTGRPVGDRPTPRPKWPVISKQAMAASA